MGSVFLPVTHSKKQRNQIRSSPVAFQNPPLIPSFLPSFLFFPPLLTSLPPLVLFSLLSNGGFSKKPRPVISIGPLGKDVYSGVSLVTGLISPWWFAIYRPGSVSRAQTITQSSHDPSLFFSITANLLQSPEENESS